MPATLDLIVGLARRDNRTAAAAKLAAHLRVDEVLLLVRDPDLGALVPAPGLPQTIRGGAAWRRFLGRCASPGRHEGEVDVPSSVMRHATAFSSIGMSFILIGNEGRIEESETIEHLLPLLDALLSTEQREVVAAAQAGEAVEAAHRANSLAAALEHARAESTRLNAELREEGRHKNEFLAMLAHELRNPLAPIVTSIAALRRSPAIEAPAQRLLEIMSRQSAQLTRLVEDLMDVSRVSQGRIELRPEPVDLGRVIADAIEGARDLVERKHHRLTVDTPEEELLVNGDAVRLTQVLSNLINNAAKYTDDGGALRVTARRDGDSALIEVADNGIGIDAAMLPRVFELFSQAPGSLDRSQGGLGIGLTLVRSLLEMHGGSITAASAGHGHGSLFTASIPLGPAPTGE